MLKLECMCVGGDLGVTHKGEPARHLRIAVIDTPGNRESFGGSAPNGTLNLGAIVGLRLNPEDKVSVYVATPDDAAAIEEFLSGRVAPQDK